MNTSTSFLYRRLCTTFVALTLACVWSSEVRADGGPSQPEAAQFEPVDVSDVVNLATGDFTYSLPLMTVPGPSGGYPLVLSYHAGIGPNQDATWVGLGWTLNPGAINRTTSGYPDDYKDRSVLSRYYDRESGYGVSLSMGWGPVGLNMTYDSHSGNMGMNMIASIEGKGTMYSGRVTVGSSGVGFSAGRDLFVKGSGARLSISGNIGSSGLDVGWTASTGRPGVWGAGYSMSTSGSGGSFSPLGASFSSVSTSAGRGVYSSSSIGLPQIPIYGGFWASLSYSEWEWKLDAIIDERAHGYMYTGNIGSLAQMPSENTISEFKQEHYVTDEMVFPTPDLFQVSAQGISGQFMALPRDGQEIAAVAYGDDGQASYVVSNPGASGLPSVFRFLGEEAGAYITPDESMAGWWNNGRSLFGYDNEYQPASVYHVDDYAIDGINCAPGSYRCSAGRTVEPMFDVDPSLNIDGIIEGFRVYDIDGKIYEYAMPVYNHLQYAWSCVEGGCSTDQDPLDDDTARNSTLMATPYATSWLLTSVVGADYVDRGPNGVGPEDWGYWVAFSYEKSDEAMMWRSPAVGVEVTPINAEGDGAFLDNDKIVESMSFGLRDYVYLSRVETATHIAVMNVEPSGDRGPMVARSNYWSGNVSSFDDVEYRNLHQVIDTEYLDLDSNGSNESVKIIVNRTRLIDDLIENKRVGQELFTVAYKEVAAWQELVLENEDIVSAEVVGDESDRWAITFRGIPGTGDYDHVWVHVDEQFIQDHMSPTVMKLTSIDLFRQGEGEAFDPVASGAEALRSVRLTSGLELAPGKPGSESGKLTLHEVEFLGRGGVEYMPSYAFDYEGPNFSWSKDRWDAWGSYRNGEFEGPHTAEQDPGRAGLGASAWSLTSVTTPTGAEIQVEYESDDFYAVNDVWMVPQGVPFRIENAANGASSSVFDFDSGAYDLGDLGSGDIIYITAICPFSSGLFSVPRSRSVEYRIQSIEISGVSGLDRIFINQMHTFYDFESCTTTTGNAEYYNIVLPPKRRLGGGHRVRSIATMVGDNVYKTTYDYDIGSRSSGATASLPTHELLPGFSTNTIVHWHAQRRYRDSFVGSRYGHGRPAPGILYGKVTMRNFLNGSQEGGRTVQEFYTPEHFPYVVSDSDPNNSSNAERHLEIRDYSSIYGSPRVTRFEEGSGIQDGQYQTIQKSEYIYAFDFELADQAAIVRSSVGRQLGGDFDDGSLALATSSPGKSLVLGGTYLRHGYRTSCRHGQSEAACEVGRIVRRFHNAFPLGNRTVKTTYDEAGAGQDFVTSSRQVAYDILSGRPIAATSSDSDGDVSITLTRPAYHFYDQTEVGGNGSMLHRNMLVQGAETVVFETRWSNIVAACADVTTQACATAVVDYLDRDDLLTSDNSDIASAEVVTWTRDFDTEITPSWTRRWLKNDTYAFDPRYDYASFWEANGAFEYEYTGHDYSESSGTFPWSMTSNVTAYDHATNVIESVAEDGTYSSSMYDETGSLVLLIASNARLDEVVYTGFEPYEEGAPIESVTDCGFCRSAGDPATRTGERAKLIHLVDEQIPSGSSRSFTVEIWVSPEAGTSIEMRVNGRVQASTSGDGWQLLRARGQSSGGSIFFSGAGYADDLRIYPDDARLSTFVYDPTSWELTSITDPTNRSTYFEYDASGRLVHTRDDTGNLITANRYAYARDENGPDVPVAAGESDQLVVVGPPRALDGEDVTYEAVYLGAGSPTLTWYVLEEVNGEDVWVQRGTGQSFTTTVASLDFIEFFVKCVSSAGDEALFSLEIEA